MSSAAERNPEHAPLRSGSIRAQPVPVRPGLMAARVTGTPGPGLMSIASRPGRGFMQPHPNAQGLDWSRDGIAFLWLLALILAFVLWIGLLGHGAGHG